MKKAVCLIIAAAMLTSSSALAFAENNFSDVNIAAVTEDKAGLFAALDEGISFEYDYSASTELVRVVKVKYDKGYFTNGINRFNAEISIPSQYTASVSYTSKLSGFNITDSYENGVYKCSGESEEDKVPVDGLLFTMRITLKQNITQPFKISLTGDSLLGDETGITQSLKNGGITVADLEIPKNINDVGDSGVDGAVTWEYANGVLKLHGNGTMKDYTQGGAPWYQYADRIKSIEFTEDKLQNIGTNAFYGLSNAENVILSADISAVNNNAFEGCTSLKNIDIPTNSGVGIGNYAFKDCSALTSVYIPAGVRTVGLGAFEGCTRINSMTLPFIGSQSGESNTKNTFSYIFNGTVPSSLKTVSITNETAVPESAFEDCSSIENIYLNSTVKVMGKNAFKNCGSLKSFEVPDGLTELQDYTFGNCSSITEIAVKDNIKSIGTGVFDGCTNLASIYVPNVAEIKDYTFRNCASLKEITIPDSVQNIGESVLSGCESLVDINIPFVGANKAPGSDETPEGIFGYLFGGDNSAVPKSVTKVEVTGTDRSQYIPKGAFRNCGNIQDIIIDGGMNVFDEAFANCRYLKNLYIPRSISYMGKKLLTGCENLETLTVPFIGTDRNDINTPTSVLGGFFKEVSSMTSTSTRQYWNANDETKFGYYEIPKTLKNVFVLNQTNIPRGAFQECHFIENVSIVSGATINKQAFYNCTALKTVSLPSDLEEIGEEAFAECSDLEVVNIPGSAKDIGKRAFYGARALKTVVMPSSIENIDDAVFDSIGLQSADDVNLMASDVKIWCEKGSVSHNYAVKNNIPVKLLDAKDLDVKDVAANIAELSTGGYLVDVTNTYKLQGTVYAAIYDEKGRMLAVKSASADSEEVEYRFTFDKEESDGISYAKVFVLGGNDKVKPMTSSVVTLDNIQ